MKNKISLSNIFPPFNINYNSSFSSISKWKIDKIVLNTNNNRITKIEIYNYFDRENVKSLIKYLQSNKFIYISNPSKYPRLWNVILNQEGKNIIKRGKIVDIEKEYHKYYYYVDFVKVLLHRGRPFLLKIYYNKSMNKTFFKLEITYSFFKKSYSPHFLDWLNALKSINEVINKIQKRIEPIGFLREQDFSGRIVLDSLIYQMMTKFGISEVNHINNIFDKLTK